PTGHTADTVNAARTGHTADTASAARTGHTADTASAAPTGHTADTVNAARTGHTADTASAERTGQGVEAGGQPDMRVTMVSVAARRGRTNEDFVAAAPTAAVLVDGAGIPGTEAI